MEGLVNRGGEAILGCGGGAVHVKHDTVGFNVVVNHVVDGGGVVVLKVFFWGREVIVGGKVAA